MQMGSLAELQGYTQHSQTGLPAQALLIFWGIWLTFTRQKEHKSLEQPLSEGRRKVWSSRAPEMPWAEPVPDMRHNSRPADGLCSLSPCVQTKAIFTDILIFLKGSFAGSCFSEVISWRFSEKASSHECLSSGNFMPVKTSYLSSKHHSVLES